jgi:hypothetical protein
MATSFEFSNKQKTRLEPDLSSMIISYLGFNYSIFE